MKLHFNHKYVWFVEHFFPITGHCGVTFVSHKNDYISASLRKNEVFGYEKQGKEAAYPI